MINRNGIGFYWKLAGIAFIMALIVVPTKLWLAALCLLLAAFETRRYISRALTRRLPADPPNTD